MAKTTNADRAKLTLWRLAADEEVQANLRTAAVRLREAGQRAARLPGSKVVEDKKLYDKIRQAAISLARALRLLRPEPEPPQHRARNLVLIVVTAGTAAAVIAKRRRQSRDSAVATEAAVPPAPASAPDAEPAASRAPLAPMPVPDAQPAGEVHPLTGGEHGDPQGEGGRVPQGAGPQREGPAA